jgi:hypothetical protein
VFGQGQNAVAAAIKSREVNAVSSAKKPTARSKITNGKQLLANIDGRSPEARRFRDLVASLGDDLGGEAGLTEAQRALVRQAAALVVQSETLVAASIRGEDVDIEQMTRVANALGRTLARLRLRKPRKPGRPSHLAAHFGEAAE